MESDLLKSFEDYNLSCSKGEIIGEAELVDCILVDEKLNKELVNIDPLVYGRSDHIGKYAWKLENIKKYENKIPIKGKLGLWNYGGIIMIHKMRLNKEPFEAIKAGNKKIELRLFDEKRKLIKVGDEIEFINRDSNEKIITKVINIYKYNSFSELYKHFNKESLGYKQYEKAKSEDMEKYYSKEEQEKYGVVGIEIELSSI